MLREPRSRRWMIQAFYPSENHKDFYPYMPDTLKDGKVEGTQVLAYGKPDAVPIQNQKFPIIIFIPGLGGERQKYTILCEALASQGYVILCIDQPYVSNFVKFRDGTKIVLTWEDAWKVPRDHEYRYHYYDKAMEESIQIIQYTVDHLEDINQNNPIGVLDKNHIVLMGHSFGGNVAHTFGFKDKRIKAIVDIDSKITDRKIFGTQGVPPNTHSKPVFFIRSMMQYQEDVGTQLSSISNATVWRPYVQHSAFSDSAYFAAHIRNFGNHTFLYQISYWFFKKGPYFNNIDTDLGGQHVETWFIHFPQKIVKWLRKVSA